MILAKRNHVPDSCSLSTELSFDTIVEHRGGEFILVQDAWDNRAQRFKNDAEGYLVLCLKPPRDNKMSFDGGRHVYDVEWQERKR